MLAPAQLTHVRAGAWCPLLRSRALKGPAEKFLRIFPDSLGSSPENYDDSCAAIECATGNKTSTGGACRSCFHAVTVWHRLEHAVGISEVLSSSVRKLECVSAGIRDATNSRVFISCSCADRHVPSGRILALRCEAMWVEEIGVFHTEATGLTVCLLYTSPSPRDQRGSRMPSSA